ncbi:MAG: four helix bundle protein [Candidatus Cloacimonetes bacterium]|nr:four helix bundle protein [Candidatus Cloacimonadota bacterium]
MKSFKDLEVWKLSIDFVEDVYKLTNAFPGNEKFGLVTQMRRAAVSISSNIAEGQGRKNSKEFIQFLYIAKGSLAEIETQLIICERLGYTSNLIELTEKMKRIRMMIVGLINALYNQSGQQPHNPKPIKP